MAELQARLQNALGDAYHIERELGGAGMSRVFLATEASLHRQVVIKLLPPELASEVSEARFKQEIEVAAHLQHTNILPVLTAGARDDLLFYVMPFVAGESLRHRLMREGKLPVTDSVRVLHEIADALAYAHGEGVIHRDVKPENILLLGSHAVLTDFGVARALAEARSGARLTDAGVALGTPAYMSPEQAAGEQHIDARADVYALAVVGYEILAGFPPFVGPTTQSLIAAHLTGKPKPLVDVRPETPPDVINAIMQALAKDPEARQQTAAEFRDALGGGYARPGPRRLSRRGRLAAMGTVVAVIGLGALLFLRPSPPGALDPDLLAVAPFDVLAPHLDLWHEGLVDYLSKSLDGAGPLRTVPPTVLLRRWRGRGDPSSARELGRRTGARLVLFGQVVGEGADSARVRGTVVDAATGQTLAEFERTDVATRFDRLADSLAADVLRDMGRIGPGAHIRLPSIGTTAWPALKAFLRGEQLLRRFSLDSAIQAYQEAVEADGRFALALRRIGLIRGWRGEGGGQPLGLEAGRFNHGLAPRDSLLIVADSLEAASDDSLDRAYWSHRVRKFRALEEASRRYPDDPEVWYELGEARFHLGYVIGSTAQQTIDAFSRAIELDAAFAPAYFHPVQLSLDRDDTSAAQHYVSAYTGLTAAVTEGAGIRLVRELIDPMRATAPRLQSVLDTASANLLFDAWRSVQRWPDANETGVRLLRMLAAGRRGVGVATDTVWMRYLLVTELLYRGHLRAARAMVGSRFSVPFAELAVMGIIPPDSAAAAFDAWLLHAGDRVAAADPPWVARCYQSFLAADWWARRRDTMPLLRMMHRGASIAKSGRRVTLDARADSGLAAAAVALARRDTAEALQRFSAFPDSLCGGLYGSLSPSLAPLHLVRFQLLAATGRDHEAARVFDQQVTMPLTVGSVLGTLERGRIAERLGDPASAAQDYHFVVAVWRNADPELRPYVEDARAGLARLGGEPRREPHANTQ